MLHLDDSTLSQSFFLNQTRLLPPPPLVTLCCLRHESVSQKETQSAAHFGLSSLKPPDVEVVMQKVWVCLPPEWEHQRRREGEGRAVNVCVCVDGERAPSEGSPSADRSAHGMACESHAPSTAVQWRSC